MRTIPLTQGKVAIVDDRDYKRLIKHRWHAAKRGLTIYAARTAPKGSQRKKVGVLMHRDIMRPPKGKVIDHINHNGLDNQRKNLRIVTRRENCQNRKDPGVSKYPGVSKFVQNGYIKWRAYIRIEGDNIALGTYGCEMYAYIAYLKACRAIKDGCQVPRDVKEPTSQYVGVSWCKNTKTWVAQICISGKRKNLGYYKTEQAASRAYQKARKEVTSC